MSPEATGRVSTERWMEWMVLVVDVDALGRFKERSRLVSDSGFRRVVDGYSVVEDVVVGDS